ncbi:MAG TPA: pyruvate kinase [Lacibacter sp.]|nr:pyruvate kinase [Lacibacter sp.]HMO87629.1 pyruvate kinase [Lacibacter sp.]HMP87251.1 pyruvate kinase [Lacibacter sp.]
MTKELKRLIADLTQVDALMQRTEATFREYIREVHPTNRRNAANLLHYMALRSLDIRDMQDVLHATGLSSLASSESHIRGQVLAILQRLGSRRKTPSGVFTYDAAAASLHRKSEGLFGKRSRQGIPYIMVTFDTCHADDYASVKNLLLSGMNVARINCAHDDESAWFRMIQQVRRASRVTGMPCKIYMDLAGPKIRTVVPGGGKLKIREGELLCLTDEAHFEAGIPHSIGCTIPGIAAQLQVGETVLFDDGLVEARVEKTEALCATLQVMRISSKKPVIRHEKGINFPESNLSLSALTDFDRSCLPFVQKHADLLGYSFLRTTRDLHELREAMGSGKRPSIILKIETPEAVKNLPSLLFSGMQDTFAGVMIARGDLAVEIGFERMSEIQEEILWICEAAHVPVIWATQVLENLNKSGIATRSEVTDAAYAAHADCVMINKGDFTIHVIEMLKDILQRSGGHHVKKRYTFRPLSIAARFMSS